MRETKLYQVLLNFNKIEQNRLRKFLLSPVFNRNEVIVNLFEWLLADINQPQLEEPLEKEAFWEINEIEQPYDDVRMRKYLSDLLKLVESFLALEKYQENPLNESIFLLEGIRQKKLSPLYSTATRAARANAEKQPHRAGGYYLGQYLIEKNYYELTDFEEKRTVKTNLDEISYNLDVFYLSEKLRIFCNALSRQNVSSHDYETRFIDEIPSLVEKYELTSVPPIGIYYQIFNMYTKPREEEYYYQLKKMLDEYALVFPKEEAVDLYTAAQNYCVRQINQGNSKFLHELFVLYRESIENGLLINDGQLSAWSFRNTVVIGLRLGEFAYIENFIVNYANYLPEDQRENALTFNLAQLYFYQKKYDKVIELLQSVEYEDITYNLNSKTMLLHTYYDTEEIDPLYFLLESFRAFLNRNKGIPESKKSDYKNLIKFTKKLVKTIPGDQKTLEKVKKEVEATKNIASRKWLLEKIAELEG